MEHKLKRPTIRASLDCEHFINMNDLWIKEVERIAQK